MVSLSFAVVVVLQLLISVRDATSFTSALTPSGHYGTGNNAFRRQKGLTQVQQLSSSTSAFNTDTADDDKRYQVSFEYCTGCKWGLRSFWMAQELLMTFEDDAGLAAVTLIPSRAKPGGVFRIKCHTAAAADADALLWDRKENDGFPKMKELKQLVRDQISTDRFLGHSDTTDRKEAVADGPAKNTTYTDATADTVDDTNVELNPMQYTVSPSVVITYCTGCRWLLRAAYFGQELLSTFGDEINSFSLVPGREDQAGIFAVTLDGHVLWDRKEEGGFPEITELKQRARDRLDPAKDLGHSDISRPEVVEEQDEEEAADARKFFGVL
jgi:selenoprotein W-related protein